MSDSGAPSEQGEPVQLADTPCRHLRCKGMYVYTASADDALPDDDDNSIYWCLKTMGPVGPDDELVGRHDCRNLSRSCFEGL